VRSNEGDGPGERPRRLVAVVGTGTDIGKTWVSVRLLDRLRSDGCAVAARKPAQSFEVSDDPTGYDASLLGAASGERPETVCPRHRWYEAALAPPMAADLLGRPAFTVSDLIDELRWPARTVDVGLVETAGGVRSPIADDGDCLDLVETLGPDTVVLVADAGLGTINAVRLAVEALEPRVVGSIAVVLNRFADASELHQRNLAWLTSRDGLRVFPTPGKESELASHVRGFKR
jgi:dethiobiotin synthetase